METCARSRYGQRVYFNTNGEQYYLKTGILYREADSQALARIDSPFWEREKRILSKEGQEIWKIGMRECKGGSEGNGEGHHKEYVMYGPEGQAYMTGTPQYAAGEDPAVAGWPLCRMPRMDHVCINIGTVQYCLQMGDGYRYHMIDEEGQEILQICHQGIKGGWQIRADKDLIPEVVCGIFLFCRYLEQENEFLAV